MYERRVLVDISHMRQDAIDETFALIEALDAQTGRATRASTRSSPPTPAYRFGGQQYNLTDGTISRIAARGGVIGLIFAQHQLKDGVQRKDTKTLDESLGPARPPHRRDRPRARRDRLRPRRLHQADAGRDRVRGRPQAVRGGAARSATRRAAQQMLEGNALRVIRTRFASAGP